MDMSRSESEVSRFAGQTQGTDGGGHGGTYPLKGVCPPAIVPCVPGQMSRSDVPVAEQPGANTGGTLRSAMPLTAGIVDELRQAFGVALVDRCIARGQQLRREHARILAVQGQAEADRWLAWEQGKGVWFGAVEGGRRVGVMS